MEIFAITEVIILIISMCAVWWMVEHRSGLARFESYEQDSPETIKQMRNLVIQNMKHGTWETDVEGWRCKLISENGVPITSIVESRNTTVKISLEDGPNGFKIKVTPKNNTKLQSFATNFLGLFVVLTAINAFIIFGTKIICGI